MAYHIDDEHIGLDELQKRIEETALIPSRAPLLDAIDTKVEAIKQQGITTMALLRKTLKNSIQMEALSKAAGIDMQYLTLLRREIESYFPKPFALEEFDWLPQKEIARLTEIGIRNTEQLFQAVGNEGKQNELMKSSGIDPTVLEELTHISDMCRVQWVSPLFARMLAETSFNSASSLAAANAEELYEALLHVNEGYKYFKGKIGLRDVKRLIHAASYVS